VTWNYRVLRRGDSYGIHEVYYDDNGVPTSCTDDPVGPHGDTPDELAKDLDLMSKALAKPILDHDFFVAKSTPDLIG
jgi:hypothetical protein